VSDPVRDQLNTQAEELALLLDITQRIASGGAPESFLPDVARSALRGLHVDCLRIVAQVGSAHQTYAGTPAPDGQPDPDAHFDLPLLNLAAANGALSSDNAAALADEGLDGLAATYPALIALPLTARGTFYGVVWAANRTARPLSAWAQSLLKIVAGQVAIALANASAFEAARRGREQLAAILSSSPDPILVIDNTERILVLNPAAEQALGTPAGTLIGGQLSALEGRAELAPLLAVLRGTSEQPLDHMEWQAVNTQFYSVRLSPMVDDHGTQTGKVLMLRDITRYKTLRENQAEFMSTVSHDLRSPLTFMGGYLSMLSSVGEINAKQQEFVDRVSAGFSQMADLVDKILDASRLDPEGNYQLNREPVDVAKLVADVVNNYVPAAEKAGQQLTSEIAPDLPILALDETMMRRVLNNLTDNAIKYTPSGGKITVRAFCRDGKLVIEVQDSGKGIPEEGRKMLFNRFRRLYDKNDKSRPKVKGSGLGLYIVRRVAVMHGGYADVDSEIGKGSTFWVHIPLDGPNIIGGK
jgi:PAS domain S-box-containing protein